MNTEERVFKYAGDYGMIPDGGYVIAGVSGGADSMCMLMLLMKLCRLKDTGICVVHVNHGIRGASAERDERYVRKFCEDNELEYRAFHEDIPKLASQNRMTLEEAGRRVRYNAFVRTASEFNTNVIAVAHNCDDNAETVLFNIFRGSGIRGIGGIRPVRSYQSENGDVYRIIRPILCLSRKEIEEYDRQCGTDWCTDETNSENDYSRNCIRNVILPKAGELINDSIPEHLMELSERAAEIDDYLNTVAASFFEKNVHGTAVKSVRISKRAAETDECMSINAPDLSEKNVHGSAEKSARISGKDFECTEVSVRIADLLGLHAAVRGVVIRKMLETVCRSMKDIEARHTAQINMLCGLESGKRISLPYGMTAYNEYGFLVIRKQTGKEADVSYNRITFKTVEYDGVSAIPTGEREKWFDADCLKEKPVVRKRRDGDYLIIGKEGHKKSLNRFFIDSKIPKPDRDTTEVLAEGSHILYVEGLKRDDSYPVTGDTKHILVVTCETTTGCENGD